MQKEIMIIEERDWKKIEIWFSLLEFQEYLKMQVWNKQNIINNKIKEVLWKS